MTLAACETLNCHEKKNLSEYLLCLSCALFTATFVSDVVKMPQKIISRGIIICSQLSLSLYENNTSMVHNNSQACCVFTGFIHCKITESNNIHTAFEAQHASVLEMSNKCFPPVLSNFL